LATARIAEYLNLDVIVVRIVIASPSRVSSAVAMGGSH
jgi:hypothetical protein